MRRLGFIAATTLLAAAAFTPAHADMPGRHPYYLHALSDLRGARWLLEHRPGDARVSEHEGIAVQQIDGAINDIRRAAIDDGKDLHDHPSIDVPGEHGGRLRRAQELLRRVHSDLDREEDDPATRGLKRRALDHLDEALRQTDRAIYDVDHGR